MRGARQVARAHVGAEARAVGPRPARLAETAVGSHAAPVTRATAAALRLGAVVAGPPGEASARAWRRAHAVRRAAGRLADRGRAREAAVTGLTLAHARRGAIAVPAAPVDARGELAVVPLVPGETLERLRLAPSIDIARARAHAIARRAVSAVAVRRARAGGIGEVAAAAWIRAVGGATTELACVARPAGQAHARAAAAGAVHTRAGAPHAAVVARPPGVALAGARRDATAVARAYQS